MLIFQPTTMFSISKKHLSNIRLLFLALLLLFHLSCFEIQDSPSNPPSLAAKNCREKGINKFFNSLKYHHSISVTSLTIMWTKKIDFTHQYPCLMFLPNIWQFSFWFLVPCEVPVPLKSPQSCHLKFTPPLNLNCY